MIDKGFIVFFILISFAFNSSGYYEFNPRIEKAYSKILSLRFDEALQLLKQEETEKPGNDLRFMLLCQIDFLRTFITEDKAELEKLKKNSSIYLEKLKSSKENVSSPFHLYAQAEINMNLAFTGVKFQEYISAATEIRRAYKLIEKNKSLYPNFLLNRKISGLLNTVIGSVPSKYQWMTELVGMEGSVTNGEEELKKLYEDLGNSPYEVYRIEILFYLGNVHSILSSKIDSIPFENDMKVASKISPLISYIYSNILLKAARNEDAYNVINDALQSKETFPFPFLYYRRGIVRLRKIDIEAEQDFRYFISHYKGDNYIKAAYQKIAWCNLLKGDSANYFRNIKLCGVKGKSMMDEDKASFDEFQTGEVINLYLLKSRLYFDGGYYKQSLSEIVDRKIHDFPHYHDQLEVTYRLGRIMQETGKTDKAIDYYELTIKNGLSSQYYFAANSALMLGIIYEEKKDFVRAESYFKKCLSIEHRQYKNSIDQKAKAGLDRLKNKH